jgi:ketosteroid isomerase-like protein
MESSAVGSDNGQLPPRLQELIDKQDIHELFLRYARAFDRTDYDLVMSVFHPDATHNHDGIDRPISELLEALRNPRRQILRSISHNIFNVLIDLAGDVAYSESYYLACHTLEHDGRDWNWIVGGRYLDRVERRKGEWRIAHRTMLYDWARVDAVCEAPIDLMLVRSGDRGTWGQRGPEDPSYTFMRLQRSA